MGFYAEIDRDPPARELYRLGGLFLIAGTVLGAVQWFVRHREGLALGLWAGAAVLCALTLIKPLGRLIYIGWMGLGVSLGAITSPIVLLVVFIAVITPVGLFFKLRGRDALRRRLQRRTDSYWEDYPENTDPASYTRQY